MLTTIVFLAVVIVGVAIFFMFGLESEGKRKRSLKHLAQLLESSVQPLGEEPHSYEIRFKYKGRDFVYEDLEERGFQDQVFRRGLLKLMSPVNLTVAFSERDAGTVRENVTSLSDIRTPWVHNIGKILVPRSLERFNVFSNNNPLTSRLLVDERVLKIFEKFKNVDSRGHPVMSLEVLEGVIILKFHYLGGLFPSLLTLYSNVSLIQEYLEQLITLGDKIEEIDRDLKDQKTNEQGGV